MFFSNAIYKLFRSNCSGQKSVVTCFVRNFMEDSCPRLVVQGGGVILGAKVQEAIALEGFHGEQLSRGKLFRSNCRGNKSPGSNRLGENFIGINYAGGCCPGANYSGKIVREVKVWGIIVLGRTSWGVVIQGEMSGYH